MTDVNASTLPQHPVVSCTSSLLAEEDEDVSLCWRMPPDESLSDWSIEIVTSGSTMVYHVHQCLLAVGPHASGYFARLLKSRSFAETSTSRSQIELELPAANAFPILLDFVYHPDWTLDVNRDNAVALFYLGKYLEVRRLKHHTKAFWEQDLALESCTHYYEQASLFHDDDVLRKVLQLCAREVHHIPAGLVKITDWDFWRRISEILVTLPAESEEEDTERSLQWSRLLSQFVSLSTGRLPITADSLEKLTDAQIMPQVDVDAAFTLLDLEKQVTCIVEQREPIEMELSSLQKRCITSLTRAWHSVDVKRPDIQHRLRQQQSAFLTELLSNVVGEARGLKTEMLEHQSKLKQSLETESSRYEAEFEAWRSLQENWVKAHDKLQNQKDQAEDQLRGVNEKWSQAYVKLEDESSSSIARLQKKLSKLKNEVETYQTKYKCSEREFHHAAQAADHWENKYSKLVTGLKSQYGWTDYQIEAYELEG